VIIHLGYAVKFYRGLTPEWFNNLFGNVAYEIFWISLVLLILPRLSHIIAAISVYFATSGIEFIQLWKPSFLHGIRATLPGMLVLGNSFSWSDFHSYFVGSFLGWLWVRWLHFSCFRL
jgi:hypothetical protein